MAGAGDAGAALTHKQNQITVALQNVYLESSSAKRSWEGDEMHMHTQASTRQTFLLCPRAVSLLPSRSVGMWYHSCTR